VLPIVGSGFSGGEQAHGEVALSYTATVAGNYSLAVTVGGEPFGALQEISVVAGELALGATPASVTGDLGITAGGEPLHLKGTAVDAFGNVRVDDVLELELRLSLAPSAHVDPVTTLAHPGDGTAELTVGTLSLRIRLFPISEAP
jgi:hypothetical protein